MLSDRRQLILRALIEEYVMHALPVGSRTLTENYNLGVSPATVRNELSALEEAGYITQPHTSAGRVPTDAGYREFVDELLSEDLASANKIQEEMAAKLRHHADALDGLIRNVSEELARLTNCLSIIGYSEDESDLAAGSFSHKERLGLASLMRKPEFQETATLLPLMEILEDDSVYIKALSEASSESDGFSVRIGTENDDSSLSGVSVVSGIYSNGPSTGVVAIIGPCRMNYSNVISAVKAARDILNMR